MEIFNRAHGSSQTYALHRNMDSIHCYTFFRESHRLELITIIRHYIILIIMIINIVTQVNELNLFFGKIIECLRPNKAFENFYPQLQNIIEKIVAHTQDFESLFAVVIICLSILLDTRS